MIKEKLDKHTLTQFLTGWGINQAGKLAEDICEKFGQEKWLDEKEYTDNGTYKRNVDPEVTCWHCGKTFLCDCMDATCRLCGAPYAKERCKEFNFIPKVGTKAERSE